MYCQNTNNVDKFNCLLLGLANDILTDDCDVCTLHEFYYDTNKHYTVKTTIGCLTSVYTLENRCFYTCMFM